MNEKVLAGLALTAATKSDLGQFCAAWTGVVYACLLAEDGRRLQTSIVLAECNMPCHMRSALRRRPDSVFGMVEPIAQGGAWAHPAHGS
jgi:hypothetical protein